MKRRVGVRMARVGRERRGGRVIMVRGFFGRLRCDGFGAVDLAVC